MNINNIYKLRMFKYYNISTEEKKLIKEKQLNINLYRQKRIYPVLLIINIILFIIDIKNFNKSWSSISGYKNLFYLHIIIIFSLISFIFYLNRSDKSYELKENIKNRFFICGSILFILIWCATLSINAQLIHGQISAYIIGIMFTATVFIINPISNLILFLTVHSIFIIGMFISNTNAEQLSGNIINSTFLVILAMSISYINFSHFIKNHVNEKIINEKTLQLKSANINLINSLNKKTKELNIANENLINEITKRHEIEMKALKDAFEYEKEKGKLNEKIEYEELRTEFFANISHEFKTPLNVIYSAQQIITHSINKGLIYDESNKLNLYVSLIKQNSFRLMRLINNLIDMTKIDVGSYNIELQNNDIVKIVEEITLSVVEFTREKNISLIFDTEMEEKIIAFDSDKIERIILNLLSNAVKFTPENGNINVSIYEENEYICISVKDNGIGIPPNMLESVFDRFTQVDKSTRREREGSGIGLSLVKSLVEMHKGNIKLISQPNKGSEFIINIPNRIVEEICYNNKEVAVSTDNNVEKINIEFSDIYF